MRVARLSFIAFMLCAQLARGDPFKYEFLLLPSAQGIATFDRQALSTQVRDEVVQVDTLFTLQRGPLKLFGEYLRSDHEGDLERLQLGWQVSDDTILWIGRFHQPTSVWNHDHHHGQYLQTSISRPAIDEWEDIGGLLPQHFAGVLLESAAPLLGKWRLRTALAGGIAPQITPLGLEPFDLLHPDSNRHQMGFQGRASLHPGEFTETGAGILLANDELTAVEFETPAFPALDHVDLKLIGVFATYAAASWKVIATLYDANARLFYTGSRKNDSFGVGYVQAEYRLVHDLTGFARWEDSAGAAGSPYLHLFKQVARSRQAAGLRWDFAGRQAFTLQFTKTHTLEGHYSDLRVQWSAAFF